MTNIGGPTIPEIWWDEVEECYKVSFGGDFNKVMNCKDALKAAILDRNECWFDSVDTCWNIKNSPVEDGPENIEKVREVLRRFYGAFHEEKI